jgi:hypothetical protein
MNEELSARERIIFNLLKRRKQVPVDDIIQRLAEAKLPLIAKRTTHSLAGMMKYLTAKACQDGWIISMIDGGRGAGNKATYKMTKRF